MLARWTLLIAICFAALLPGIAHAERRVALVIGNAAYKHASALRNPINDADDVGGILKGLGFEVLLAKNLDQENFARTIEQFARMLDDAEVALFFYAGHGLQVNDKNYLVSVNARLENEFLLSAETMELDSIVRLMESKSAVNIVFLDACRNNPLAENLRRSLASLKRGANLGRGLAKMEVSGRDTLIAFAAAPGQEASDGSERNSPFTSALIRHLPKPGLEVSVMLKEVAAEVRRDTRNSQRPQQLSDMTRTFYFAKLEQAAVPAPKPPVAPPPAAPTPNALSSDDRALDMAFWSATQSANDCEAVRHYLQRFPQGIFVELAKLSERRLCQPGRNAAVADPAPRDSSVKPVAPPAAAPPPTVPPVPPVASLAPAASAPTAPDAGVARDVQLELIRLGCATGGVREQWSAQAKEALRKFNRHAKAKLDLDRPSPDTVAALRGHGSRVCPLECGRGTRAQGDTCVAIERAEPPKSRKAEPASRQREREREHKRREATPARAEPVSRPPAKKASAADKPGFWHQDCTSRTQIASGKWCCSYDPPRGPTVVICP